MFSLALSMRPQFSPTHLTQHVAQPTAPCGADGVREVSHTNRQVRTGDHNDGGLTVSVSSTQPAANEPKPGSLPVAYTFETLSVPTAGRLLGGSALKALGGCP